MDYGALERIVVVGGGKMGEAIMGGWLADTSAPVDTITSKCFTVIEPDGTRRSYLEKRYGVVCLPDVEEIPACDLVILAVKPQVMMDVVAGIIASPLFAESKRIPLFVSIAAGLSTKRLEGAFPAQVSLVRVMPNMPLLAGAGVVAVCGGTYAACDDVELVRDLFACLGNAYIVDEQDMDAVGAVSGSGPAYVAAMIEAMRDAGVKQGLDASLAEALTLQTVYGTCELMKKMTQSPADIRLAVCSPGGTTLAALAAMNDAGFLHVFDVGIDAAVRRSKELSLC